MKGKRAAKKARRLWLDVYMLEGTSPMFCKCGHEFLPASWHSNDCYVFDAAWRDHPDGDPRVKRRGHNQAK